MKQINLIISLVLAFVLCGFITYLIIEMQANKAYIVALEIKHEASENIIKKENGILKNKLLAQEKKFKQDINNIKINFNILMTKQKNEYETIINNQKNEISAYKLYEQKNRNYNITTH